MSSSKDELKGEEEELLFVKSPIERYAILFRVEDTADLIKAKANSAQAFNNAGGGAGQGKTNTRNMGIKVVSVIAKAGVNRNQVSNRMNVSK